MVTPNPSRPHPTLGDVVIEGLGLIDSAELTFQPGLNVLTGETGAGKTLVVTALQLLSGKRADRQQVNADTSHAVVQGVIYPTPAGADEWGDSDEEELLVTREIAGATGGRNRVRIQGKIAPVAQLEMLLAHTIELHGQHESLAMADAEVQRSLLDRFDRATILPLRTEWQDVWTQWRTARKLAHDARVNAAAHAREAAQLHRELEAIDAVNPQSGEEDELKASVVRIQNAESLAKAYHLTTELLGGEDGVQDLLGRIERELSHARDLDPQMADWGRRINVISTELADLSTEVSTASAATDADPEAFERVMNRMADLKQLFRLYGATSDEVIAHANFARERLALIDGGDDRLQELDAEVERLTAMLADVGERLHGARTAAAKSLEVAVQGELADLAMGAATMHIEVAKVKPGPYGIDAVQFLITTNPGQPPVTLDRAASGGERSRIALALKVVLADADDVSIMVFDEVDAGIGGQTALVVGQKLQQLATEKQVLCVTHLAQIAAHADAHFLIQKTQGKDKTTTEVRALDTNERQEEIARMLSGTPDEQVALAHASQLLAESARDHSLN